MDHTHPMPGRRISGLSAAILALTLTGCPLLDPPEPLNALLAKKEEKLAFKVDKEKNSVCRITKDFDNGRYVYDHLGRLYQYTSIYRTVTFHYDAQGYLVTQDFDPLSASSTKTRWNYLYESGLLSKVESYDERNGQRGSLTTQMLFESGKPQTLSFISGGTNFDIPLKTDGSGRITELTTDAFSPGVMVTTYFEYDARGNLVKSYNNASPSTTSVSRYSEIPNPSYAITRFKGHQFAGRLDYFGGTLHVLGGTISPDLIVFDEVVYPNSVSTTSYHYDDYNPDGYPSSREFSDTHIVRSADYENCN